VIAREAGHARKYFQKLRDVFEGIFEIPDLGRPGVIPRYVESTQEFRVPDVPTGRTISVTVYLLELILIEVRFCRDERIVWLHVVDDETLVGYHLTASSAA
jgi:hypothetical protein